MARKKGKYEAPATPVREGDPGIGYVIPFFLVMAVLTVVSFIIPLRPTVSYIEKRNLAEFPEFSVEALVSGDYFDDITTWYSDTFPGREEWLSLATYTSSFYGRSEIMIQGDLGENTETVPTDVPEATGVATLPPEELEEEESLPTETIELTTEEAPTTPVEEWGGVDAGGNGYMSLGAVIQIGDSLFTQQGFSQYESDRYAAIVNSAAAAMEGKDVQVVSMLPPTAVGIMVEPEYLPDLNCANQGDMVNYINGSLSESVIGIDTVSTLIPHNSEYIYFRTDHHWTALAAYYCYVEVMESLGMEPAELLDFEPWNQGDFRGSLYYKAPQTSMLTLDTVYAYNPPGDITTMIYESSGSGFEWTVLTDMSKSNVNSKYMTFLAGDHALVTMTNHSLPEDAPNCVIIKDSYGNCLAPFFTQNFRTVYVLDYRYYNTTLTKFVDQFDIDVVIFAPNLGATQSNAVTNLLKPLGR